MHRPSKVSSREHSRLRRLVVTVLSVVALVSVLGACVPLLEPSTSGRQYGRGPVDAVWDAAEAHPEVRRAHLRRARRHDDGSHLPGDRGRRAVTDDARSLRHPGRLVLQPEPVRLRPDHRPLCGRLLHRRCRHVAVRLRRGLEPHGGERHRLGQLCPPGGHHRSRTATATLHRRSPATMCRCGATRGSRGTAAAPAPGGTASSCTSRSTRTSLLDTVGRRPRESLRRHGAAHLRRARSRQRPRSAGTSIPARAQGSTGWRSGTYNPSNPNSFTPLAQAVLRSRGERS